MPTADRLQLARACYDAYATGDRHALEALLSDDFTFSSPADEATRRDGGRFRNTEILTFAGEKICRAEVYFGWDLD